MLQVTRFCRCLVSICTGSDLGYIPHEQMRTIYYGTDLRDMCQESIKYEDVAGDIVSNGPLSSLTYLIL